MIGRYRYASGEKFHLGTINVRYIRKRRAHKHGPDGHVVIRTLNYAAADPV